MPESDSFLVDNNSDSISSNGIYNEEKRGHLPSYVFTFLLWLFGGWAGLHRLYLGDRAGASEMCLSLGGCVVGWLSDGFRLRDMVEKARCAKSASSVRVIHALSSNTAKSFCHNRVSNTKYGATDLEMAIQFLPMSILEQLERNTNRYFLFIAILQLDPSLTPTNPLTTWLPLAIIFFVTAARELADDRLRLASDRASNNRTYLVAKGPDFVPIASEFLRVGDVVLVRRDQEVPADAVLLAAASPDAACHLETANLDGEADLKIRRAAPLTAAEPLRAGPSTAGGVELEVPWQAGHELKGLLRFRGDVCPLSESQSLPQGSSLRNVEWAVAVVIYTGNETRLGRSRRAPADGARGACEGRASGREPQGSLRARRCVCSRGGVLRLLYGRAAGCGGVDRGWGWGWGGRAGGCRP